MRRGVGTRPRRTSERASQPARSTRPSSWSGCAPSTTATTATSPDRRGPGAQGAAYTTPTAFRLDRAPPRARVPHTHGAHPTMISTGELRKGVTIELDNELWKILDYHHIKMGRGSAQVRITLRNVKRGQTVERSFQAGTKWPRASMEKRPVQFLYRDDDDYHFMDTDTYDQFHLTGDQLGDTKQY